MSADPRSPSGRAAPATTAADDEIARFDRIARTWWDPEGDFRPLHRLHPVRIDYLRQRISAHFGRHGEAERPLDGLAVIDIGCGGGLVSESMARLGARVTGIDASEESVRVAEHHARGEGLAIHYRRATPEDLASEGERFDVVLALEVIEHVTDLDQFIAAATSLLANGGPFAFSTINRTLKSLALAKIGAEYVLRWLPVGTHDWRKFVKPSELAAALRRHGLMTADIAGLIYDPAHDAWSLGRDPSVNYIGLAL